MKTLKRIAAVLALLSFMACLSPAYASGSKPQTGVRTRANSPVGHPRTSRPYYGGGRHTTSHGGQYPGATNAHHKNGHYQNWRSSNRYGVHKP